MRTSLPCVQPTLLTLDLNLCPCKVQSQELVHINSSRVRGPKTLFCVAFASTAITFPYELGLRRPLARWKTNEKLHPKNAKTSSTPFQRAFRILPCRCEFRERRVPLRTTSRPCIHPTLLTVVLNLSRCMVQSQELVHFNGSRRSRKFHTGTEGF